VCQLRRPGRRLKEGAAIRGLRFGLCTPETTKLDQSDHNPNRPRWGTPILSPAVETARGDQALGKNIRARRRHPMIPSAPSGKRRATKGPLEHSHSAVGFRSPRCLCCPRRRRDSHWDRTLRTGRGSRPRWSPSSPTPRRWDWWQRNGAWAGTAAGHQRFSLVLHP
jgi:hypothetical protein